MTQAAQAGQAAAPPVDTVPSSPAVFIGGRNWRERDVFWGSPGGGGVGRGEMLGYLASFKSPGRPKADAVADRVANVWTLRAVYCLNAGAQVLYVGEGVLGDRLCEHAWNDEYAGKWDTFSWLAPGTYTFDPAANPKAATAQADLVSWSPSVKGCVEFLELVAIQFGMPIGNRQQPDLKKTIAWLGQVRSSKLPKTQEELLYAIAKKLGV